jgi:hypothetical protein
MVARISRITFVVNWMSPAPGEVIEQKRPAPTRLEPMGMTTSKGSPTANNTPIPETNVETPTR